MIGSAGDVGVQFGPPYRHYYDYDDSYGYPADRYYDDYDGQAWQAYPQQAHPHVWVHGHWER